MIQVCDLEIQCNCAIYAGTHLYDAAKEALQLGWLYMVFNDRIYDLHDLSWDYEASRIVVPHSARVFSRQDGWHPAYEYTGSVYVKGVSPDTVCTFKDYRSDWVFDWAEQQRSI